MHRSIYLPVGTLAAFKHHCYLFRRSNLNLNEEPAKQTPTRQPTAAVKSHYYQPTEKNEYQPKRLNLPYVP